ncbi:hypothetical protein AeRB84_019211 [Aphanomyces euteiches]|nr:hypothetical protein AeRB84_019211 [Aphanomyces euteiches]
MPRWTKDCEAQRALEKLIDDHKITAHTKAQVAYNLDTDIFHQFNFPAFQKHFDSTIRMRFAQSSGKRRAPAPPEEDVVVPFLQPKSVSEPPNAVEVVSNRIKGDGLEGLVAEYYNITTKTKSVVVVLTPPCGATTTCEVDEEDPSILRVTWTWTDSICDPTSLFKSKMVNPTTETILMVAALEDAYANMCGKNGSRPQTQYVVDLPRPVRKQRDCMKISSLEGPVKRILIELVAETGTRNSEFQSTFRNV